MLIGLVVSDATLLIDSANAGNGYVLNYNFAGVEYDLFGLLVDGNTYCFFAGKGCLREVRDEAYFVADGCYGRG